MLFKLQLCIFRVSARGQKKKWSQCSARRFHHTFCMGGAWRVMENNFAYAMATKSSALRYHILHGKLNGAYEVEIRIRGFSRAISR